MDQPPAPQKTPTPADVNDMNVLCTPQPAQKRPTVHVATPDLDHQAKKIKTEGHEQQEGLANIEWGEAALGDRPPFSNPTFGRKVAPQNAQVPESPSMMPQEDPSTLVAKYEQELGDLRAQIHIKDRQLQNLKEFIAVQHLQPAITQGPDDTAVTSRFSVLRYAITSLTEIELNGHPFFKPTKAEHKNLFSRLTKTEQDYKEYLGGSHGFKRFFFEGVIWTKLIDKLLYSPLSAFLVMKEGLIRRQVYVQGGASPQKFHAWRAYTADFLEDAFGPRTPWSRTGVLRKELVEDLAELLSRYSTSGAGNVANLMTQLDNVVDKAINLAWVMAKSRAYWVCCIPKCPETKRPYGFIYQTESVKVQQRLEGGRRNIVDLVGRPSLCKYGDSNGQHYDTSIVVEKAVAVVFEGKKPNDADASYVEG